MEQWNCYQKLKSRRLPELQCEKHSIGEHKANISDQLVKKKTCRECETEKMMETYVEQFLLKQINWG